MVRRIQLGWPFQRVRPAASAPVPQPQEGWVDRARPVAEADCDAIYPITPDLYIGPGNDFTPAQWRDLRVAVPPPDMPLLGERHATATAALAQPDALAGYYQRLVTLAHRHGVTRSLRAAFPLFAVEPAIIAGGKILTSFAWYEGAAFTRAVLEALAQSGGTDGVLWDGMDQGWAGQFEAQGSRIGFVDWDPDQPGPLPPGISMDRTALAEAAAAALERFNAVQAGLIAALGRDYWR